MYAEKLTLMSLCSHLAKHFNLINHFLFIFMFFLSSHWRDILPQCHWMFTVEHITSCYLLSLSLRFLLKFFPVFLSQRRMHIWSRVYISFTAAAYAKEQYKACQMKTLGFICASVMSANAELES